MTALDRTRLTGPLGSQGAPAKVGAPCDIKTGSVEGTPKKGEAFFGGEEEQRSERCRPRKRAAERRSLLRRRTRLTGPLGSQGAPTKVGAPCDIKTGSVEGDPEKRRSIFFGERRSNGAKDAARGSGRLRGGVCSDEEPGLQVRSDHKARPRKWARLVI